MPPALEALPLPAPPAAVEAPPVPLAAPAPPWLDAPEAPFAAAPALDGADLPPRPAAVAPLAVAAPWPEDTELEPVCPVPGPDLPWVAADRWGPAFPVVVADGPAALAPGVADGAANVGPVAGVVTTVPNRVVTVFVAAVAGGDAAPGPAGGAEGAGDPAAVVAGAPEPAVGADVAPADGATSDGPTAGVLTTRPNRVPITVV